MVQSAVEKFMVAPTETLAVGFPHTESGSLRLTLVPDFVAPSSADIDFVKVRDEMGLKESDNLHAFFDLDGTIRRVGEDCVDPVTAQHLRNVLGSGQLASLTITSNSYNPGTARFGWQIDSSVETYTSLDAGCSKPNPEFFRYARERRGIADEPVLVVGDKVTRDVLGARRVGGEVVSLLVPRLGERDLKADRIIGRRFDIAAGVAGALLLGAVNRYETVLNML